jgi:hypothetical protein
MYDEIKEPSNETSNFFNYRVTCTKNKAGTSVNFNFKIIFSNIMKNMFQP